MTALSEEKILEKIKRAQQMAKDNHQELDVGSLVTFGGFSKEEAAKAIDLWQLSSVVLPDQAQSEDHGLPF